jgi:hypothetical protein
MLLSPSAVTNTQTWLMQENTLSSRYFHFYWTSILFFHLLLFSRVKFTDRDVISEPKQMTGKRDWATKSTRSLRTLFFFTTRKLAGSAQCSAVTWTGW